MKYFTSIFVLILIFICSSFLIPSLIQQSAEISSKEIIDFKRDPLIDLLLKGSKLPQPSFPLFHPGKQDVLNYLTYGEFKDVGMSKYRYVIKNRSSLSKDIGAGLIPNVDGVKKDFFFQKMKGLGVLSLSHWDALKLDDHRRAFYIWTQAHERGGVRTYFSATILEKAGHILQAVKAYYATVVHYPRSYSYGKGRNFTWYCAQAAMDNIKRLTRDYPGLNISYVGSSFDVKNGYDARVEDDIISVNPGHFIKKTIQNRVDDLPFLNEIDVVEKRGAGRVQLHKFANGHWMMTKNGEPFYVRGVSYNPTTVGIGPKSDRNFLARWMFSDMNKNGKNDAGYDAWVDANNNNVQDLDELPVGDFALMQQMGVNAIRLYAENNPFTHYDPSLINKPLLRQMHKQFGIYVILGDFLGAYTVGSGATWEAGTDYRDPKQRELMKEAVRQKVLDLKDEPFVLMWLLGNENNMDVDYYGHNATRTNASQYPKVYAKFLNEVATMIHELDPDRPVMVGNIDVGLLEYYREYAPALDVLGINSYRGTKGFGDMFQSARRKFDRPIIVTEYGCDAYYQGQGEDQQMQKVFIEGKFRDLIFNQAGGPGEGNVLGGVIFEYLDEWWKDAFSDPEDAHQTEGQFPFEVPDGISHEEWFGIVGQGDGSKSPFMRRPRGAYQYFKSIHESLQKEVR